MIHDLMPSLAEGGKIKIGGLAQKVNQGTNGGWRAPVKYDHFLITKTSRTQRQDGVRGDLEMDAAIMAALAEYQDADKKLRRIPIVLHSDEIDEVFPTAYACYTGTKLHCRGDGREALRWTIDQGQRVGDPVKLKCPCPYLNAQRGPICKPHGTLHCGIIVDGLPVAGSVYKWRTTSIISIRQMIGSLEQIKALCGSLRGIPLQLRVLPVPVTPKSADGRTITVYVCHVELRASDVLAVQERALEMKERRIKLGLNDNGYYRLVQRPGIGETPEEEREIQEEFHQASPEDAAEVEAQPPVLKDDRGIPVDDPGAILDNQDPPAEDRGEAEPCINANQITRLFTIVGQRATQLKLKRTDVEQQLKAHLKAKYGVESTKAILVSWYDDIVAWVQTSTVAVPFEPGSNG